ncbi:LacI family transcriptional regulator [Yoonia sp. R2331]|uniref:LacI family transcriptional regulator n=1 Tax=Yoonia sp. R2331 TaxID=3237238 RepID=UPI0034E4B363
MSKNDETIKTRPGDSASARGARKQPTLKTIAALTGLAVPTVSRALGGASDISATTRARVRAVADEIGYVPNRAGVRLRTGRTNVIALVLSTEHEVMNHTAKLISSVAAGLRETPFHLNITPYFGDEDPMKPIRYIVETRSADAVIFNQTRDEDPRVAYLRSVKFPFATHGRTKWSDEHAYYDYDNAAFGALGVQELAKRGRKNILLVAPPTDQRYGKDMVDGSRTAGREYGVKVDILSGASSDNAMQQTEAAIDAHIASGAPVDGLICGSNSASIAAMSAVERAGMVLGDSVDLFSKEAIPILKRIRPSILTVHEDVAETGRFLAKAAMSAVLSPNEPALQFLEVPSHSSLTDY